MKPFHKRIGRGIRKYHLHFTKYLYERDTIFATIWVFLFILILGAIPINTYVMNPIKLTLKDFDFNDITYSQLGKGNDTEIDTNIVIINIGHEDRAGIAALIDKVAAMQPKVMALDVMFDMPKDSIQDSILRATIVRHKNLVMASRLSWEDEKTPNFEQAGYFGPDMHLKGYTNLIGESKDERNTIRYYSVYEKERKKKYLSFAAAIIKEYDSVKFAKLEKRKIKQETLNYSRRTDHYFIIQPESFLTDNIEESTIKGKIALLGYINEDPNDIEDKIYSPMNAKFAGKSTPDMNGLIVHANFISMVLENNYIKKLPSWVNWLVAVLIGWLHMSFFVRYYLENHIWFHLVAKIAQIISAIFFAYVGIYLFDRYNIKLDMKLSLVVIVLAVDVIYFYEAFAVWIHKKFHYHTVFHQKHH